MDFYDRMKKNWGSEIVARRQVEKFTGGLISSKTMANIDGLGDGPPRILCGRNVGYPTVEFVEWLKKRGKERWLRNRV